MALELGLVAAWGASTDAARRWCEHAERLIATSGADVDPDDATDRVVQIRRLAGALATLDADLTSAISAVESTPLPRLDQSSRRFDVHVATVTARALLAARHPLVHEWIDRISVLDESPNTVASRYRYALQKLGGLLGRVADEVAYDV